MRNFEIKYSLGKIGMLVIKIASFLSFASCACIVRESFAQPICDSCNTIRVSPMEQKLSRFVIIGPIIPLIPFWFPGEYPSNYIIDLDHESLECPLLITSQNDTLQAMPVRKQSIYRCIYSRIPIFDTITLKTGAKNVQAHYLKRVNWSGYFGISD